MNGLKEVEKVSGAQECLSLEKFLSKGKEYKSRGGF
jgi:hypothetical protein